MNHHNHRESRIENPVIYVPIRHLYICREPSTNQLLFMQNKPNVKDAQINVNSYMKSIYEKLDTWLSGKNKANSNPIKANLRKAKMNVKLYFIEDYRKKDVFAAKKTNPIQTQFTKGQNRLPENLATPASAPGQISGCNYGNPPVASIIRL